MRVQIRSAVAGDALNISTLMLGEARHITLHPDGRGAQSVLDSMRETAILANIASPRFSYWIAEHASTLQGVISLRDGTHLYQMFVPTKLHGRGIGRQLWQYLLDRLIEKAHAEPMTVRASDYAVPIYQRFGFAASGDRTETSGVAFTPMIFRFPISKPQEP